jgi:hypothetical protein
MAITIASSISAQQTDLQRGVVQTFASSNDIVRYVPVYTIPKGVFEHIYNREDALPSTGFRNINADFTASYATYEKKVCQLHPFGATYDVDVQLDTPEEAAKQTEGRIKSAAATLQAEFFDGTMADGEFSGLNEICDDEGAKEIVGGSGNVDGLTVLSSETNAFTFLQSLKNFTPKVRGEERVWFMSETMMNVIELAAYKAKVVGLTQIDSDFLGKKMMAFNNIPILVVTYDAADDDVLGFDETLGDSTDCGSLYCANIAEQRGVTFVGQGVSNIVDFMIFDPTRLGSKRNFLMEIVLGLASKRKKGVRRMYGIRNS